MKILFVNNFLFTVGGVETYIKSVADELFKNGHEIEFFGMYDVRNTLKNSYGIYSRHIDFKTKNKFLLISYSMSLFYSIYNKVQFKRLLKLMKPDIVHLNNINYIITTSILSPLKKLRIPVVKTIHDAQITCANHRLLIPIKNQPCTKCKNGNFSNSFINRCIDGSIIKSFFGMLESYFNRILKRYMKINLFIFPSKFMLMNHIEIGLDKKRFEYLPNFARLKFNNDKNDQLLKKYLKFDDYNLYFGRLSIEKGIHLIVKLTKNFPSENFVFVGSGPLKNIIPIHQPNVQLIDFVSDNDVLSVIVQSAKLTLCPSIWYENSPLNLIESLSLKTPVLAANIGGIPEFIEDGKNGLLFKSGDYNDFSLKFIEATKLKNYNKLINKDIKVLDVEAYVKLLYPKYVELINKNLN